MAEIAFDSLDVGAECVAPEEFREASALVSEFYGRQDAE